MEDTVQSKVDTYLTNMSRSPNEQLEREALRNHFTGMNKNKDRIKQCKKFTKVIYPTACILFIVLFWITGMAKQNGFI